MRVLSVSRKNRDYYSDFFPSELRFLLYRDEYECLGLIDQDADADGDADASSEAVPAGVCIYSFRDEDSITIEWLYIDEAYRNNGYSELLLDAVYSTALYNYRSRIVAKMWQPDPLSPLPDSFLTDIGFIPMAGGITDEIYDLKGLKRSFIEKNRPEGGIVRSFLELPSAVVNSQKALLDAKVANAQDIDLQMSHAIVENGLVTGSVIIRRIKDTCFPALVYFDNNLSKTHRLMLICQVLDTVQRLAGDEGMLCVESPAFDITSVIGRFFDGIAVLTSVSYEAALDFKKKEKASFDERTKAAREYREAENSIPKHMIMIGLEDYL